MRRISIGAFVFTICVTAAPAGKAAAQAPGCMQPHGSGSAPNVRDCLYILQAGRTPKQRECQPRCICDADGDGTISATDALICLRDVIGLRSSRTERCSRCFEPLPKLLVRTHGSVQLDAGYWCESEVDVGLSIFLAEGGRGWVSVEGAFSYADVVEVAWTQTPEEIAISPNTAYGELDSDEDCEIDVGWRDLVIDVTDADGDGTSETGVASATMLLSITDFWLYTDTTESEVRIDLADDPSEPVLALQRDDGLQPFFPFADALTVRSSRPLLRETVDGGLGVLVDDQPREAQVALVTARGPFTAFVRLDPVAPLPFDASIGIAALGAADAWHRPARFNGYPFRTVPDPGPITENLGFENDAGWRGLRAVASDYEFRPIEGLRLAAVTSRDDRGAGELIGYFDVPERAKKLSFWMALDNPIGDCSTTSIALHTRNGKQTIYPGFSYDRGSLAVPWTRVSFDLIGARGERVAFRATPSRFTHCLPDMYEHLVLDGFQIR